VAGFTGRESRGRAVLRQKAFGRYIVDFYCASAKLVIELDGEVHDTIEAQAYDALRTETLESRGLLMLRFCNDLTLEKYGLSLQNVKLEG
jgi:very-short-patch-repair endonuclease